MGLPGIICGGMCGMFGGGRNGGRCGFCTFGGCCRGGIPGLRPCRAPGPDSDITGGVGDPSWLLPDARSEGMLTSALGSVVDSSGDFTAPAGVIFVWLNSVGMMGAPPGGMAVGDNMIGPGKASGLPMAATCSAAGP